MYSKKSELSKGKLMRYVRIISFVLFAALLVYAYASGLAQYLNFAFVKQCGRDLFSYT